MIGMEPPVSFDADAVRSKKTELFEAVHSVSPENAVRGQYGDGSCADKKFQLTGTKPDVAPDSGIETYVALKLGIDNWRWAGVPFYLRHWQVLPARTTEIAVQFRRAPYALFRNTPVGRLPQYPDSPHPTRRRTVGQFQRQTARLRNRDRRCGNGFCLPRLFRAACNGRYEPLIYDCFDRRPPLCFQRADTVEAAWRAVEGLIDCWARDPAKDFPNYPPAAQVPRPPTGCSARDGRAWVAIRASPPAHGDSPLIWRHRTVEVADECDSNTSRSRPKPLARQHHARLVEDGRAPALHRRVVGHRVDIQPDDL